MTVQLTSHIKERIRNRGIQKSMVDITLDIGIIKDDKYITNRKNLSEYLQDIDLKMASYRGLYRKYHGFNVVSIIRENITKLRSLRNTVLKMIKKGGITVVACGNSLITTYRTNSFKRPKAYAS